MNTSSSKLVTPVYYRYNQLRFPKDGLLELTQADTVRVVTGSGPGAKVEFDVPLTQVQRLRVWRGILMRLRINDHTYWIDMNPSRYRQMKAASPGLLSVNHPEEWVQHLKSVGVHAQSINLIKIAGIMAGVFVVLQLALYVLATFLVQR